MADSFMLACDFIPGAQVRIGKGFTCLREGAVHIVTTDNGGNACLRCQYEGQKHAGWHYPTMTPRRLNDDEPLNEIYLERAAHPAAERREP
jgi:hypothetical protein